MAEKLLELVDVSKHFSLGGRRSTQALSHVNLTVYRGETLGVLGESGCGKSTLARVIMGVYPPSGGQVFFQESKLSLRSQGRRKEFARHAQMIFQDPYLSLDPHMTVGAIIAENLEIHGALDKRAREARVCELLELTGLPREYARRFPHEFSGGQRQRIGIARALAAQPDFMICDEPVSALDTTIQAHIMSLLIRLKSELDLTYLFIAHDVNAVRSISDRIAVMYAGRVVELGDAEAVCDFPRHPYTQMLLRSVLSPVPDKTRLEREVAVTGEVAPLTGLGPGCPFAPRCPLVAPRCRTETPELFSQDGAEHFSACFQATANRMD